jgi:hypothetical protein
MYRQPCTTIACVFGVLLVLGTLVPSTVLGQSPQATVLRVEGPGASTPYQVEDMGGRVVEVAVPSLSLATIQSKQSDGIIAAKVVAVDTLENKVKVVTQAGQIIELAMPAQDIQIGEPLQLAMPWKR